MNGLLYQEKKKKQLFELEIKNTGYQLLEYETNDLYWYTYIKLYDENMNMLADTSFKNGENGSGITFYSYYDKGTKLYLSVDTGYNDKGYIKFKYHDIADDRYPKTVDDISESTELKTKVFSYSNAETKHETFKYKVKESGAVTLNLNWVHGYSMGALENDNRYNYIAVVNEDGMLVDVLYPIIKKKNKLETYLKKGTYYIVVILTRENKGLIKYELYAKNKKDGTVEHEWNRAVEGNKLQKLKLNKEVRGKIAFNGGYQFSYLTEAGIIDSEQRTYDNDSFDFIAPSTRTYTFTVTPVKSRLEKLKSVVWLDVDTDKYVELTKKGKNLVANVPLKKGQKVYLNVYNGFGGQHYKVKVK